MKQGMTINELAQQVDDLSKMKRDFVLDTRSVDVLTDEQERKVKLAYGEWAFDITPHAMSQIQQRLKIDGAYFARLRDKHPRLLAENIEYLFHNEPEVRMFRGVHWRGIAPVVRAVLSNSFKRIDNEHVLRATMPVFAKHPDLRFQSTGLTPLHMHVKATLPTMRREVKVGDIVEIGLGIANSEVGLGQVDIYPFIYKLSCLNGARINIAGMKQRHLGRQIDEEGEIESAYKQDTLAADDKLLALQVRDTVDYILDGPVLDNAVDQMKAAMENTIKGSPTQAVRELTKSYALSSTEGDLIMQHLIRGGDLSQFGLMNAVTAASADLPDYDRATEFEAIGGKILSLNAKDWTKTYELVE